MSRQNGYTVTIKAFVPSPRNDFEKQAAAAVLMAAITKTKTIPAEFLALASIEDVSAKYGSRSAPEAPAVIQTAQTEPPSGTEPPADPQSDEPAAEGVRKAAKSRG